MTTAISPTTLKTAMEIRRTSAIQIVIVNATVPSETTNQIPSLKIVVAVDKISASTSLSQKR